MLMHPIKTAKPRDWVENAAPTPQQLRRWFLSMTTKEQNSFMERITEDGAFGFRCREMDHDGQIEGLQSMVNKLAATGPEWDTSQDTHAGG